MKPREIEIWALHIIDYVTAKKPIEDSQVELKGEWPEPKKAARRIAGHANASGSDPILWLIGVDENRGVIGCDPTSFPAWYQQVSSEFDEIVPSVREVALPFPYGIVCMALQFDTDRAPYVTKNPVAGQPNSGPVSLEVPWRVATSVRSATRRELLKILVPYEMLPEIDVLEVSLAVLNPHFFQELQINDWVFNASLYFIPPPQTRIVIPFHRCILEVNVPGLGRQPSFDLLMLNPLTEWVPSSGSEVFKRESTSRTIQSTETEVIIDGPGLIKVKVESPTTGPIVNETLPDTVSFKLSLARPHSPRPAVVSGVLNRANPRTDSNEVARWIIQTEPL